MRKSTWSDKCWESLDWIKLLLQLTPSLHRTVRDFPHNVQFTLQSTFFTRRTRWRVTNLPVTHKTYTLNWHVSRKWPHTFPKEESENSKTFVFVAENALSQNCFILCKQLFSPILKWGRAGLVYCEVAVKMFFANHKSLLAESRFTLMMSSIARTNCSQHAKAHPAVSVISTANFRQVLAGTKVDSEDLCWELRFRFYQKTYNRFLLQLFVSCTDLSQDFNSQQLQSQHVNV